MKKIIFSSYIVLPLLLLIFSYLFVDPGLIFLKNIYSGIAFKERQIVSILYLFLLLAMFFQFLFILKKISEFKVKQIFLIMAVTSLILVLSYPAILSYDIFNYYSTAKVTFHYFENPYLVMPIEFTGDPVLLFTHAANKVALYGPLWILATGIPFVLSFNNFILTILNLKLLVAAFYFLTSFLIYRISKSTLSLVFFALNPLIIIEVLVSGHNDIVMMFFALLSVYLLQKKRFFLGIVCLILSILIKYATIILIPVLVYFLFKKVKNQKVEMERIYLSLAVSMFVVFMFSPIREEIYPWYATWFLVFLALIKNEKLKMLSIIFSFSLLLRYSSYMFTGNHFGLTPYIKIGITILPVLLFGILLKFKPKLIKI